MPRSPQSLALTQRYHDVVARQAVRLQQIVVARFRLLDTDSLEVALDEFIADATQVVEVGQEAAAAVSRSYLTALTRTETGKAKDVIPVEDNAGLTVDGRPVADALAVTKPRVLLALKQGRPLVEALRFGEFSASRFARTEVMDAARQELQHGMEQVGARGWRWRSRGTCPACLAMDDGRVRDPSTMPAHPGCRCIPEPVFPGREKVTRETGRDRYDAMGKGEQDRLLGAVQAELLRRGLVEWSDLFQTERPREWRAIVTRVPEAALLKKAGVEDTAELGLVAVSST